MLWARSAPPRRPSLLEAGRLEQLGQPAGRQEVGCGPGRRAQGRGDLAQDGVGRRSPLVGEKLAHAAHEVVHGGAEPVVGALRAGPNPPAASRSARRSSGRSWTSRFTAHADTTGLRSSATSAASSRRPSERRRRASVFRACVKSSSGRP